MRLGLGCFLLRLHIALGQLVAILLEGLLHVRVDFRREALLALVRVVAALCVVVLLRVEVDFGVLGRTDFPRVLLIKRAFLDIKENCVFLLSIISFWFLMIYSPRRRKITKRTELAEVWEVVFLLRRVPFMLMNLSP